MTKSKEIIYVSVDIEADGPYPLDFSMLSFAAVAFRATGEIVSSFEVNIETLEGSSQDPDTMEFWGRFPDAWEYCQLNKLPPTEAMNHFCDWVENDLPTDAVKTCVCAPVGFDYMFLYLYLRKFAGRSPFGFSALDIKSYVSGMRKTEYRKSGKNRWPARWKEKSLPHTHKALDDALEQGLSFLLCRQENITGDKFGMSYVRERAIETLKDSHLRSYVRPELCKLG